MHFHEEITSVQNPKVKQVVRWRDRPDRDDSQVVLAEGYRALVRALAGGYRMDEVRQLIADTPGVILYDDPAHNRYPMPILAHHRDEVWVGRVRRDASQPNSLNLWVVADNIRKGAATNAIQILDRLSR